MTKETSGYDFSKIENDRLTRPRDLAWQNWAKFEKIGDEVVGYIRDAFYRKANGQYPEQRGITIEQPDGKLINVGIKRRDFVLAKTDNLRIGDPIKVKLIEFIKNKGLNDTKVFEFFGTNIAASEGQKTVKQMDDEDRKAGGSDEPEDTEDIQDKPPFEGNVVQKEATADDIPM